MSVLEKFTKQPLETEVYSMQWIKKLAAGESLLSTWAMLYRANCRMWDNVVQSGAYTVQLSDYDRIIVTSYPVTMPTGMAHDFRFSVSNQGSGDIEVGDFSLAPMCAAVYFWNGTAWSVEASTQGVLIDAGTDQRVRTFVSGGHRSTTYKVQVVVSTNLGRTLAEEFIIKVIEQ